MKLTSCKSALTPTVVYSTERSKAVVLVLVLLFVALWFMSYFVLFCFSILFIIAFRFDALTDLGAFMRTDFSCISVLRVASEPGVKLVSCKSVLNPTVVYSTDRSMAIFLVLVLLFVALWFILRGELFYGFMYILFLCFPVLLALRLPR